MCPNTRIIGPSAVLSAEVQRTYVRTCASECISVIIFMKYWDGVEEIGVMEVTIATMANDETRKMVISSRRLRLARSNAPVPCEVA